MKKERVWVLLDKIKIEVNGKEFYADLLSNGVKNRLVYEGFAAETESKNIVPCMRSVANYINFHQEFLKPNGPIELRKTLDIIVERVCKQVFP